MDQNNHINYPPLSKNTKGAFPVVRQECSGRDLTIGFVFALADYLDLHVG